MKSVLDLSTSLWAKILKCIESIESSNRWGLDAASLSKAKEPWTSTLLPSWIQCTLLLFISWAWRRETPQWHQKIHLRHQGKFPIMKYVFLSYCSFGLCKMFYCLFASNNHYFPLENRVLYLDLGKKATIKKRLNNPCLEDSFLVSKGCFKAFWLVKVK